jgi:hypothetical protein
MTIDEALYTYLSTYAGLISLLSTRVYPEVLPQNVIYPAIVYQQIDGDRVHVMGNDSNLANTEWQLTCWGDTITSARAIAAQLRAALQNYSGTMGGAGGVTVQRVYIQPGEASGQDAGTLRFYVRQSYLIWHEE